ncbi:hypothetical protein MNV84_03812 [Leishmania braziliensis]|nr:hypothetical protein MNV84_03812 [Leishmania braziliensis]
MSGSADKFTGEPQSLSDESGVNEQEVPQTMATSPVHTEVDSAEEDSEVGHEVAPPRAIHNEDNVGYYAQLRTAEEDLAVNVACDVRPRQGSSTLCPTSVSAGDDVNSPEYEEMVAEGGEGSSPSRFVGVAEHRDYATITAAARQPTQGTQVDADVDVGVAEKYQQYGDDDHGGTSAPAATDLGECRTSTANASAALHAFKHQPVAATRASLLPQAPHGTAEVTVTMLPMGAVTRLTVPVHRPNMSCPVNAEASAATPSGLSSSPRDYVAPHWVLVAKDLFEGIARRLLVHPQSFRLFHQHKRLRFMGTLFLDCDVTSTMEGRNSAGNVDDVSSGAAGSIVNDRAEPIWVSIAFPEAEDAHSVGAHSTGFVRDDSNGGDEEAQASLMAVPAHLCNLGPDNYVARCIRVRPHKFEVPPQALVDGHRQGYSYDEVIRRMQAIHDAQQLPESHGGRGGAGPGDGASTAAPNFAIVAVLQDGPVAAERAFLGGYRDKRRPEKVRLHAATQLYHRDLDYSPFATATGSAANRCTRQTQTLGVSRSCQTRREGCVQTPRVDLLLNTAHDFIVVARPYFTAAELQALRVEMAIIIQKMYRQWKARRIRAALEVAEAARQHRAGERQRREEALQKAVEDAAQLRRDDPRSAADFERVKQDIFNWRADEAARIQRDPSLSPTEIRAALLALTETELQLLQQLDQRRREVGKTQQEKRFMQTLNRMAAPKQWGTVHVSTPETQRAAELRDLYERLCLTSGASATTVKTFAALPSLAQGDLVSLPSPTSAGLMTMNVARSPPSLPATETANSAAAGLSSAAATRVDTLLRVKWTVREFSASSGLTQELCELIDREADLLHRGRKEASLTSLRKRIQSLFAQFIEDPQYNPVAKEFAQTAHDRVRVKAAELAKEKVKVWKGRTTASV